MSSAVASWLRFASSSMQSEALARRAKRLTRSGRQDQIAANGDRLDVVLVAASPARLVELADALRSRPALSLTASVASLTQVLHERDIVSGVIVLDWTAHKSRDTENRELENLELLLENPALSALVLVDNTDRISIRALLTFGSVGLLSADASASEMQAAIIASAAGLVTLDPEIASQIAERLPRDFHDDSESVEELTRREIEVLRLLARGFGNKEVAARLGISEHTAKFHISSILGKLAVSSRTEAVTQGLRRGLILL
jgi:NarL family two-component system response regulator YdfI